MKTYGQFTCLKMGEDEDHKESYKDTLILFKFLHVLWQVDLTLGITIETLLY